MEFIQVLGYLGALSIGLVLGVMGSGGSLLAVPIFTYLFQISPSATATYSLFVVGTSASIGALRNYKNQFVDFKITFLFAIPCIVSVYLVRKFFIKVIPLELFRFGNYVMTRDMVIMTLLASLMSVSGYVMLKKRRAYKKKDSSFLHLKIILMLSGITIGILTGIIGIGGGFLIVPVLVICLGMPIKKAVTTSLFIVAIKSLIGFFGDLGRIEINWSFLIVFNLIAISGIIIGRYLSNFIEGGKLKKFFGCFLLLLAAGIFLKELFF